MTGLEESRRELIDDKPDLYAYIEAVVCARHSRRTYETVITAPDVGEAARRVAVAHSYWLARKDLLRLQEGQSA